MNKYQLSQHIDLDTLQSLFAAYSESTNIQVTLSSLDGEKIIFSSFLEKPEKIQEYETAINIHNDHIANLGVCANAAENMDKHVGFLTRVAEIIQSLSSKKTDTETLNQKLRLSNDRYRDLTIYMQDMVKIGGWELDVQTMESFWTKGIYDIYGVPYGTALNKLDGISYYAEHEQPRIEKCVKDCLERGIEYDEEFDFVRENGEEVIVRSIGHPIYNEKNEIVLLRGSFQDITKLKKIEKKLKDNLQKLDDSLHLLKSIEEHAAHALISTTLDGTITSFSRAAEKLLGYNSEELVNKQTPAVFHELDEVITRSAEYSEKLGRKIEPGFETFICHNDEGLDNSFEWIYVHKDGSKIPVNLTISTLWDTGQNKIGYLGIAEDLRTKKKLEQELEFEKLKLIQTSKLATLGEMAAGVAHEINNPLAIISASASLLCRENIDTEKKKRNLEKIKKSVGRISKIVLGLKKFSRTTTELSFTDINLSSLISESLTLVEAKSKKFNVSIRNKTEKTKAKVKVDEIQIEQILINLLGNAIDANMDKEEAWVEISHEEKGLMHNIIIKDSGNGIEPQIVENIFAPFYTTKEVGSGTGLGLSISKGIAEEHGGALSYETIDGHTSFILSLPKNK